MKMYYSFNKVQISKRCYHFYDDCCMGKLIIPARRIEELRATNTLLASEICRACLRRHREHNRDVVLAGAA